MNIDGFAKFGRRIFIRGSMAQMKPRMNIRRSRPLVGLMVLMSGAVARAAAPASQPSTFEAHEWAVFVYDGLSNKLNADGIVTNGLPAMVPSHRRAQAEGLPPVVLNPIGVIRFTGACDEKIDVELRRGSGSFMASWPRAQERTSGLLWRFLPLQSQPGGDGLSGTDPAGLVARLRKSTPSYTVDYLGGCEPFLLYDAELPYSFPLKIESVSAGVRATNTGATAVRNLSLFRQTPAGWTTAAAGDFVATTPTSKPSTQATTKPTTAPAAPPLVMNGVAGAEPNRLASDWVEHSLGNGSISEDDRAIIADLLTRYGFNGHRLTAVYSIDGGEMDRMLPIDIMPQPRKIDRLGIIICRNIDPSAGTDVDDLIGELGDPSWAKRESATKALMTIGASSIEKLRAASKNADLEVAWRAQRVLTALKAP